MDLTNESTMSLFQELEEVEEVKEEETTADSALLSNLISQCGIPVEQEVTTFPAPLPTPSTATWRPTRASLRSWRTSLAHRPTLSQRRDPEALIWSRRHQ